MRSKSKTPKHLANQGGRDDRRRARRAAIGATVLVAGSALYGAQDAAAFIRNVRGAGTRQA